MLYIYIYIYIHWVHVLSPPPPPLEKVEITALAQRLQVKWFRNCYSNQVPFFSWCRVHLEIRQLSIKYLGKPKMNPEEFQQHRKLEMIALYISTFNTPQFTFNPWWRISPPPPRCEFWYFVGRKKYHRIVSAVTHDKILLINDEIS